MNDKLKSEFIDDFFKAVLTLETVDECYAFFGDACTVNEIQAMAQRFSVARMLDKAKTYVEIGEKTGASTATISRVNRSLHYGLDGYKTVFERLDNSN